MIVFYNLFCWLYELVIRLAAPFNAKASLWIKGRDEQAETLASSVFEGQRSIWFHCSSLGEFEQGRPLIEALRKGYPQYPILITFFSPSGFEIRKNYEGADKVLYLPMDSRKNTAAFVDKVRPALAIFVKYEFWRHYLNALKKGGIPVLLVSAAFRADQPFFKWYGGFFRQMLSCYQHLFVQDEQSAQLLANIGVHHTSVAGDTRYDRVADIAAKVRKYSVVESFASGSKLLIAGSTWAMDEELLAQCLPQLPAGWKLVIAPHEIHESHINSICTLFDGQWVRYTEAEKNERLTEGKRVLIVDNMGMLASLYSYGTLAYIGGGFNKGGIHNILEPAAFGLPVLIGPVYKKFVEAVTMVERGFVYVVDDAVTLSGKLVALTGNEQQLQVLKHAIGLFMQQQIGATKRIMNYIEQAEVLKQ